MIQELSWWLFLAIVPVAYWLVPLRFRFPLLGASSLFALMMLAPVFVAQMLALSLVVYGAFAVQTRLVASAPSAFLSRLQKPAVSLGGILCLIILGYLFNYKYWPQIAGLFWRRPTLMELAIPIGISYFCFKIMHYAIERGRGTFPQHGLPEYLAWLFLMPTFTSGPIERFEHFLGERTDRFSFSLVVEGGTRIAIGLIKRFVLVEQLNHYIDHFSGSDLTAFAHGLGGEPGAFAVWAYLSLSLIILYLDFSAYSDIAIGASRLFGLRIMENFEYPLLATNLADFWRRWHMSLTGWCRAYIYMPVIGITRNPYIAVIATFILVGLWHGGSIHWLAWGLWHGVGQAGALRWSQFARKRKIGFFKTRLGKLVGWALTFAFVTLGGALVAFYQNGHFIDSFRLMGRAFGA